MTNAQEIGANARKMYKIVNKHALRIRIGYHANYSKFLISAA